MAARSQVLKLIDNMIQQRNRKLGDNQSVPARKNELSKRELAILQQSRSLILKIDSLN